ncbi:MAG TPA: glycosyltransferase [bacterium]|nr:glycosyltransferase [bacterium]HPM59581.1 glycosyltransferase [bacterium]
MKKVLMLSYYFPPLGMGGTQRAAKFARYLPEFGWEPTVLTVKPISYWAEDSSLLEEMAATRIVRTGSLDPQRLLHLLTRRAGKETGAAAGREGAGTSGGTAAGQEKAVTFGGAAAWLNRKLLPWFLLPDSKILWRWHATRAAARLLRSGEFSAIWSTSPPHSTHLIARRLAHRFRLPWVADFRDEWAGGVVVHEPTPWHRRRQQALQVKVARAAAALIGVTPGIVAGLEAAGGSGRCHLITNGFDAADLATIGEAAMNREEAHFTLCHCGSISRFSNPAPLLEALIPGDARWLRLRFIGYDANGGFEEQVRRRGLEEMISWRGYLPHREALVSMAAADALLLIACDAPKARFIPGKTFEYLASRKPILAISNVEETIRLLEEMPGVILCAPDQPAAIRTALLRLQSEPELLRAAAERNVQHYDRRDQAGELARILDRITEER